MQDDGEKRRQEMAPLAGKVAIVTGASNGIGRAIAERLAHDGATVVVNYGKSADKAKTVVAGIVSRGGNAVAIQADMSKVSDARRLVRETVQRFGRLDILVNNAGMFMYKPLVETTEEEFDRMFALNAKGPYFALQEAAKVIEEGGRIVNISTDGTHIGFAGATVPRQQRGSRTVHERSRTRTCAQGDHREYGLSRVHRHCHDARRSHLPPDRRTGLAAQATRHAQGHRRRRGLRGERRGALADRPEHSRRRRRGDVNSEKLASPFTESRMHTTRTLLLTLGLLASTLFGCASLPVREDDT